jgi:uncharacterized protein YlxW (UPF0749 family)
VEIRTDRRIRNTVTAAIAMAAGFLFVASGLTAQGTNLRTGGLEDLRGLIVDRAQNVAVLTHRVSSGQSQIDKLTAARVDPALSSQISHLQTATGLTPLTGPALEISMNDAPRAPGSTLPDNVTPDDLVVHQQDVQAVVNAMWRGGATGVQVMDQRIVSTSAIRCVGNTLLLQGRVYSPPFVVIGVGNVADLQRALDEEPGVVIYKQYVDALGLGWKVSILRETTLPGWQGTLN